MFITESSTWALRITQEPLRLPMSTHERSWTLMRTHEYGVISAHSPLEQCSFILMHAYEFSENECSRALVSAHEWSGMLMNAHVQPWAPISMVLWCHDHSWAPMSAHGHSWVLMSPYECSWSLMIMAPGCHEHSWALKSAHGTMEPYSCVLLSDNNCSWVILRGHECSWVLIVAHEC